MEMSSQLHSPAGLHPGKELPRTHWIGHCVGTRAGLDAVEKKIIAAQEIQPVPSSL
jgi:hypothetical protein